MKSLRFNLWFFARLPATEALAEPLPMNDALECAWNLRYVIGLAAVILLLTSRVEASMRQSIADPTMPAKIEKGTSE